MLLLIGCQNDEPAEQPQFKKTEMDLIDTKVKQSTTVVKSKLTPRVVTQKPGIVPESIVIPSINLKAPILPVGLQKDGTMEVPKDVMKVGWYTNGAKPGQSGNVVLAGHVDNYLGPGIFFNLKEVTINDEIIISNQTKSISYKVIKVQKYPYQEGPLEEIFGFTSQERLHLITCTGTYNPFNGTHSERLVVTAIVQE